MCQRPGRAWKFLRWLHGSRLLLWAFLLWLFLSFRRDANKGGITHGRGYNVRGWVILGLDWDFVWNSGLGTLKLGWALASGRGTGTGTGTACCFSGCQNKVKNQMFLISTLTASWQRSINFDNIFFFCPTRSLHALEEIEKPALKSWNLSRLIETHSPYAHTPDIETWGIKKQTNLAHQTCWQV